MAAPVVLAEGPAEVAAAITATRNARSLTLVLLNDRLTEELCFAVAAANRQRSETGAEPLPYGLLTGFTPGLLAWLVIKTLVMLSRERTGPLTFTDFDALSGSASSHLRDPESGAMLPRIVGSPWTAEEPGVLAIHAHGVSFDAQLGPVALCGHYDPPLEPARLAQAPVCFHDGVCFRITRGQGITSRVLAVDASPWVWFLNSCTAVPFAGSAFGNGTGYVFGLLAGAAVGVIGPYLTLATSGWLNRAFAAVIATGMTLGEAAAALCQVHDPRAEFDAFLLLGSPDVRFCPSELQPPSESEQSCLYVLRGLGRLALRLTLPSNADAALSPLTVIGDDGGEAWEGADCQLLHRGSETELLVVMREPLDLDGWLRLGPSGRSTADIRQESEDLQRRLAVLANYPFAREDSRAIEACHETARQLLACAASPQPLRGWLYKSVLLEQLQAQLDSLQQSVASHFLAQVVTVDFSFERESHNDFEAGELRRSDRHCPGCGTALYTALDRWLKEPEYRRRKDVCPNCIGISMVLETSPLAVEPPRALPAADGRGLQLWLRLRNRSCSSVRTWIAVAPRHGPLEAAIGPLALDLAGEVEVEHLFPIAVDPDRVGVLSFRFALFCQGSAEFHNCNYANVRRGDMRRGGT